MYIIHHIFVAVPTSYVVVCFVFSE